MAHPDDDVTPEELELYRSLDEMEARFARLGPEIDAIEQGVTRLEAEDGDGFYDAYPRSL